MKKIWNHFFMKQCSHDETLVVRSVGVERTVCEKCGHLSFTIAPTLGAGITSQMESPKFTEVSGF